MRLFVLLFSLVALARSATLVGYSAASSSFSFCDSSSGATLPNFRRSASVFAQDSPSGPSSYGPTPDSLLTTNEHWLCEWNGASSSSEPVRCTSIPGPIGAIAYVAPNILLAIPADDLILSMDYASFQVAAEPWMSSRTDSGFRGPSAIEYDSVGGTVYVALEDADCVRRYSADGFPIDLVPWVYVPRPHFLVLARASVDVPSLYVLTSDQTLPELYRLRLGDGASLSVLADEAGDWSLDSLRSIAIGNGALYALFNATKTMRSFSLTDGSEETPSGPYLLNPASIVRDASGNVDSVVDSYRWTHSGQLDDFVFDQCSQGTASGATLDGSAIVGIFLCDNSTVVVADPRSVYKLSLNGSGTGLCFSGYEWFSSGTAQIVDAFMGDTSLFLVDNSWNVYSIYGICRLSSVNNLTIAGTLPPYSGSGNARFALDGTIPCELRLDASAILACSNGTFYAVIPASLASAIGAAWDSARGKIWIAFSNGSVVLADSRGWQMLAGPVVGSRVFEAFFFESGSPSWIISDDATSASGRKRLRVYAWVMATEITSTSIAYSTLSILGTVSSTTFAVFGHLVSPPTTAPPPPSCNPGDPACKEDQVVVFIVTVAFLFFWVVIFLAIIIRRHVRANKPPQRYDRLESRSPKHVKGCEPARGLVRRLFCFCTSCYDENTGFLRCCYCLLGGRAAARSHVPLQEEGVAEEEGGGFVATSDPAPAVRFSIAGEEEQPPLPSSEPFGGSPVLQQVDLKEHS